MIDFLVDKKNTHLWPKQCVWHHLGPLSSPLPSVTYCYIIAYMYNGILVKKKTQNKKKNTDLMAQTMHLGLFLMWWMWL